VQTKIVAVVVVVTVLLDTTMELANSRSLMMKELLSRRKIRLESNSVRT